jgi:hypothetical protein
MTGGSQGDGMILGRGNMEEYACVEHNRETHEQVLSRLAGNVLASALANRQAAAVLGGHQQRPEGHMNTRKDTSAANFAHR